jgi:hypothetical protein
VEKRRKIVLPEYPPNALSLSSSAEAEGWMRRKRFFLPPLCILGTEIRSTHPSPLLSQNNSLSNTLPFFVFFVKARGEGEMAKSLIPIQYKDQITNYLLLFIKFSDPDSKDDGMVMRMNHLSTLTFILCSHSGFSHPT